MSFNIDKLLRAAKADIKAGRALAARVSILPALEKFPGNARLVDQLAEAQAAATRLPPPLTCCSDDAFRPRLGASPFSSCLI